MNTCTICGKEMRFVEGDIIHEENWYHGICVKARNQNITDNYTKDITSKRKYAILD
jgi:hypothetical protein